MHKSLMVNKIANQEAINRIERHICNHMDWCGVRQCEKCAVKLGINALGKQISKTPIYSDYEDNGYGEILPTYAECPTCGREIPYGTWNCEDAHHCECGQALDWEDFC